MLRVPGAWPRRLGELFMRRHAVAWVYLGCFAAVQVGYALLGPRARASFVSWASTSVANLGHDPVGCLVVSAFVSGGGAGSLLTWLPVIAIAMFGACAAVGGWRTVAACAAGHVVGTLVSEGIVAWRVASGALPASYRHLIDVGPSYVVVSALVVALLCGSRWWRVLAALDLLLLIFAGRIFAGLTNLDVSAVGHVTAMVTAAVCVPLLTRHRERDPLGQPSPELQSHTPRSLGSAADASVDFAPASNYYADSARSAGQGECSCGSADAPVGELTSPGGAARVWYAELCRCDSCAAGCRTEAVLPGKMINSKCLT